MGFQDSQCSTEKHGQNRVWSRYGTDAIRLQVLGIGCIEAQLVDDQRSMTPSRAIIVISQPRSQVYAIRRSCKTIMRCGTPAFAMNSSTGAPTQELTAPPSVVTQPQISKLKKTVGARIELTAPSLGPKVVARCLEHLDKRFPRPIDSRFFYAINLCRV